MRLITVHAMKYAQKCLALLPVLPRGIEAIESYLCSFSPRRLDGEAGKAGGRIWIDTHVMVQVSPTRYVNKHRNFSLDKWCLNARTEQQLWLCWHWHHQSSVRKRLYRVTASADWHQWCSNASDRATMDSYVDCGVTHLLTKGESTEWHNLWTINSSGAYSRSTDGTESSGLIQVYKKKTTTNHPLTPQLHLSPHIHPLLTPLMTKYATEHHFGRFTGDNVQWSRL